MMSDMEIIKSFAKRNIKEEMYTEFVNTVLDLRDPEYDNSIEGKSVLAFLNDDVNDKSSFWKGFFKSSFFIV